MELSLSGFLNDPRGGVYEVMILIDNPGAHLHPRIGVSGGVKLYNQDVIWVHLFEGLSESSISL